MTNSEYIYMKMVANAGIALLKTLLDSKLYICRNPLSLHLLSASLEDFERIYSVNTRGVFLCYKYAAKQMIAQGKGGRIIGA